MENGVGTTLRFIGIIIIACGLLAGCGPKATDNGEVVETVPVGTKVPASYSISPDDPNGCQPVLADLAEAQCVVRVTEVTLRRPGTRQSNLIGPAKAARQKLDTVLASAQKSACAAQIDSGLELGIVAAMTAGASAGNFGVNCGNDGCDAGAAVAEMAKLCVSYRERSAESYCAEFDCKAGATKKTAKEEKAIWRINPDATFSLRGSDIDKAIGSKSAVLEFVISDDLVISEGVSGSGGDVRVILSCDPLTKFNSITLWGGNQSGDFFTDDSGADIGPRRGVWKVKEGQQYMSGFQRGLDEANFAQILQIIHSMHESGSVKIGKLPQISFQDPDDLIGKMVAGCG